MLVVLLSGCFTVENASTQGGGLVDVDLWTVVLNMRTSVAPSPKVEALNPVVEVIVTMSTALQAT